MRCGRDSDARADVLRAHHDLAPSSRPATPRSAARAFAAGLDVLQHRLDPCTGIILTGGGCLHCLLQVFHLRCPSSACKRRASSALARRAATRPSCQLPAKCSPPTSLLPRAPWHRIRSMELATMDERLLARLTQALAARDEILEAYLFGSRARGRARSDSDVDVAVYVAQSAADEGHWGYRAELTTDLDDGARHRQCRRRGAQRSTDLLYHRVFATECDCSRAISAQPPPVRVRRSRATSTSCRNWTRWTPPGGSPPARTSCDCRPARRACRRQAPHRTSQGAHHPAPSRGSVAGLAPSGRRAPLGGRARTPALRTERSRHRESRQLRRRARSRKLRLVDRLPRRGGALPRTFGKQFRGIAASGTFWCTATSISTSNCSPGCCPSASTTSKSSHPTSNSGWPAGECLTRPRTIPGTQSDDLPRRKRPYRLPAHRPEITAKSWLTEAPMRMLMNNLHPEVAENPNELVVYGGVGRAARTWATSTASWPP